MSMETGLYVVHSTAKITESRKLNRKTDITSHQSISEIGPNGIKLIYEI